MQTRVGIGSEVFFEMAESGIMVRATGLPAQGPIHRPREGRAASRVMLIAGGAGRRG
jgi:hypothetical protein